MEMLLLRAVRSGAQLWQGPPSAVTAPYLPFTIGIRLFGNSELLPTLLARYAPSAGLRTKRNSMSRKTDGSGERARTLMAVSGFTWSDAIDVCVQSLEQSAPFQNRRPYSKMPDLQSPPRGV